jgi:hypothetical protein
VYVNLSHVSQVEARALKDSKTSCNELVCYDLWYSIDQPVNQAREPTMQLRK